MKGKKYKIKWKTQIHFFTGFKYLQKSEYSIRNVINIKDCQKHLSAPYSQTVKGISNSSKMKFLQYEYKIKKLSRDHKVSKMTASKK